MKISSNSRGLAQRRSSNIIGIVLALLIPFFHANDSQAATYYVNAANSAPQPPYTSWLTAATNIQDAIAMTSDGDTVLVTNGVYAFGGAVVSGYLTNRVAITNAITVESVNGPWVTTISGTGFSGLSPFARCAWLTNGASLIGFTLTGGGASGGGPDSEGGGVWCASSNALIQDCVFVSNSALGDGAAAYQGTLDSCLVRANGRSPGVGAVYQGVLNHCTIVSNYVIGVYNPLAMTNCIIYYNDNNQNYSGSGTAFSHCCIIPALAGAGNFTNAPSLFADGVHLQNGSPCIGAGIYIGGGTDIFGNAYSDPPSVGCAEWVAAPVLTAPQLTLTGNPVGFSIGDFAFNTATPVSFSWLENGQPLVDNGHFSGTQTSNLIATGVSLADAGTYQVIISNSYGSVTSSVVNLTIHCVNGSGTDPIAPYTSWANAATNIQDAITASGAGDVVLVTNGLYDSGGKSVDGLITNRVSIDKAILVTSVNGPTATIIQGAWDPSSTTGPGAVRCVWMTNNAILGGFKICGGATREAQAPGLASDGGGVLMDTTNSATVCNCILSTNIASDSGGGIFGGFIALYGTKPNVIGCTLIGNQTTGRNSYGGGADGCNLQNCILLKNVANCVDGGGGGGADSCNLKNCALIGNSSYYFGTAANNSTLINCTIISNTVANDFNDVQAVYSCTLTNCIVINNFSIANFATNYASSTLAYCCADPLPPGPGNIDVNPQVLADGFHLAQTSPCIGAGTSNGVSGTDIDGQPWKNPPSIGCDEWYPQPIIIQPGFQIGYPPHDLTWNVSVAGQAPFEFFWSQDGVPIQDDGHHSNSGTANMIINDFGPGDAGVYQLIVTNSFGSATSAPVQVVIHAVDASGANPLPPYSSWATAATNIQDAINVAAPGDIVLVTNGVYSHGGLAVTGTLTNRVALNKPITVISVNGFKETTIQGAWDPISTNGPGAVRCAYVGDGAVLNGFTLADGATYASGDAYEYGPLESGGGVLCNSTNGLVSNCELTNNSAVYGGGTAYGTVDNSLIIGNEATYGGGALFSSLNNCTVVNNEALHPGYGGGGGTYSATVRNSIVILNWDDGNSTLDDDGTQSGAANYAYSCSSGWPIPLPSGAGNTNADPVFIDLYHISTLSPCYGAGNAAYSTGYDLDGQPWNNPPSMGCSEIVASNLAGPLSVSYSVYSTNVLVGHPDWFFGTFQGKAAYVTWSFGDGPISIYDATCDYQWTTNGDYTVTFTAYNNDNPDGVSTSMVVHVQSPLPAEIQAGNWLTNGFGFQFAGQINADYTIQYATNLAAPVSWQTLQTIYDNTQSVVQVLDSSGTNAARFYRVLTQ